MTNKQSFLKNTIMLYILKISNYIFSFVTVPLQTRVLGVQIYGLLGFSLAFANYFQNFVDFGFNLSATERISKNENDKDQISLIYTKVIFSRLVIILLSCIIFFIIVFAFETFRNNFLILFLYFISAVLIGFIPDFLYLGIQNMSAIMYRSICSRAVFTLLLFLVLKDSNQFYLVPIFNIFGNLISLIFIFFHINNVLEVKFVKISWIEVYNELKYSIQFFLANLATTIYTSSNILVLGFIFGSNAKELGYYKSADQSIYIAKQSFFPIIDSIYPYMNNKKDYKKFFQILAIGSIVIIIGTIIVDIFAYELCSLVFGNDFIMTGKYLRLLSPSVLIAFLTMMCGYPLLSPLGLSKYVNISYFFTAFIHIFILFCLHITNNITISNICILINFTELFSLVFRVIVYLIHKRTIT